jgi:hypothetical protein
MSLTAEADACQSCLVAWGYVPFASQYGPRNYCERSSDSHCPQELTTGYSMIRCMKVSGLPLGFVHRHIFLSFTMIGSNGMGIMLTIMQSVIKPLWYLKCLSLFIDWDHESANNPFNRN